MDVRFDKETVWLTQRQMAEVFQSTPQNIVMHMRNVFSSKELDAESTSKDFLIVRSEGQRTVRREVKHYNLDAIISVGYRIHSKRAVRFRQWATRTLREHLVSGYTMNERRLAERGLDEARQTLELLARTLRNQALVDETGQSVLDLITRYADTWRLLLEYDEDRLKTQTGAKPATSALSLDTAVTAIKAFRRDLAAKGEATSLFGNRRGEALEAILGNVEQTMFGEPLYRSGAEKAANLLYFLVKDHPFTDGNKRIGALLFLLYLTQEGIAHRLDPRGLTALTLLIAESAPSNKDLMIRLIVNLLGKSAMTIEKDHMYLDPQAELTTQQAADLINVSKSFLVKLLDSKEIPHRRVGTHRRILFSDLKAYDERTKMARSEALDKLTEESQSLGMYD